MTLPPPSKPFFALYVPCLVQTSRPSPPWPSNISSSASGPTPHFQYMTHSFRKKWRGVKFRSPPSHWDSLDFPSLDPPIFFGPQIFYSWGWRHFSLFSTMPKKCGGKGRFWAMVLKFQAITLSTILTTTAFRRCKIQDQIGVISQKKRERNCIYLND